MQITAEDLDRWAAGPEARYQFPELVRRLIAHAGARLLRLDMASGSGTDQPGWDGVVEAAEGNTRIPAGSSRWEFSCAEQIERKASDDFGKRTSETNPEERARTTFVFATPRKWLGKRAWAQKASKKGWKEVRAYDAHDLVQWLEQTPAVALWLAEKLGKAGPGVESVDRFFARWLSGSNPAITAQALSAGRVRVPRSAKSAVQDWLTAQDKDKEKTASPNICDQVLPPLTIRADSEEEAAAFAAAVLKRNPSLAARAAVVTASSGWQWVKQNPDLRFVLCASSELAKARDPRPDLIVLVPHARGDAAVPETNEPSAERGPEIALPRPDASRFAAALQRLGIEEPRALALANRTGRSWSAFRRLHATSPAFGVPPWRERPEARALSTLALFGAFEQRRDGALVAEVAGRPWEEIECHLRLLADLPDAPVLEIGGSWKAKAIGELFVVMAPRITKGEIDRFLDRAQRALLAWSFPGSPSLRARQLADALVRLAVLGPGCLNAEPRIEARVRRLVHELLDSVDASRWSALAPHLPALAEAAPEEFLDAIERALAADDSPIAALVAPHNDSRAFAFSWLLRALEMLAWDAGHLLRVAEMLCALVPLTARSNTSDDPARSLLVLFRPWYPQTNATLEARLAILDTLRERYPEQAFELCLGMLPGADSAWPHARPRWRDDWLRPVKVTRGEYRQAAERAADRAIELAEGNPERLARLVEALDGLLACAREAALLRSLARYARTNPPDAARLPLRDALRHRIYLDELRWKKPFPLRPSALALARLWRAFAPRDPVLRHAWLFDQQWASLPGHLASPGARESVSRRLRERAAGEIHDAAGIKGLFRLAEAAKCPRLVEEAAVRTGIDPLALVEEALARGAFGCGPKRAVQNCVQAAIRSASPTARRASLENLVADLVRLGRPAAEIAEVLAPYRADPAMRDLIEAQPQDVRHELRLRSPRDADDIRALLAAGRPVAALKTAFQGTDSAPTALLFGILEKLVELGEEPNADTMLLSHFVAKAVRRMEDEPFVDRRRLAELELDLLHLPLSGENVYKALRDRLVSDPDWFVELVQLTEPGTGPQAQRHRNAYSLLFPSVISSAFTRTPRLPGQREDDTVEGDALATFFDKVRRRANELGCLAQAEGALSGMLAAWLAPRFVRDPKIEEWLPEPVAALLDRPDLQRLRETFGCHFHYLLENHSFWVGERPALFQQFRERLHESAPRIGPRYHRTADCLRKIARDLEEHSAALAAHQRCREEGLW